jgi:hypothetical protein
MVGSFPSPVETVQDGAGKDEMGRGADSRPNDHHHLERLIVSRRYSLRRYEAYLRLGVDSLASSEDGDRDGRSGSEDTNFQYRSLLTGSTYMNP